MRTKRASTYQCCYICGQWGFGRADYHGTRLCVDCEADVMRQWDYLGGPKKTKPSPGLKEGDPLQIELPYD